ncbi:hypothetical protein Sru01_15780 [Sphaerisporangium rufum]|uniref:Anti-sigma factor antagonist n=1 Tax=Sphaerisporangium rufum TaxID=1381558 RepID=A0A919QYT0_9ACTN|nr:STAS domain-containing protein [Sphaerisporangium rufum]GII76596.1 hypothetical protein Sru01_15780 [Sphaerisporangium rufum]
MQEKTQLNVEVVPAGPGVTRLVMTGDLDYHTAGDLSALLPGLFGAQAGQGTVMEADLSGLEFIDSSGVAALIHLYQACEQHEMALRIVALTSYLRHLFQVTALDRLFDLPTL